MPNAQLSVRHALEKGRVRVKPSLRVPIIRIEKFRGKQVINTYSKQKALLFVKQQDLKITIANSGFDLYYNRPFVPNSCVGWFRPTKEEDFHGFSMNFFWKLSRDQPTRLFGTGGRFVDIERSMS